MLFKNREIRIKLANTKKDNETVDAPRTMDEIITPDNLQLINEHMKKFAKNLAITVAVTVVAIKVVDTLGEIAVKKTKSADKE